CRRTAEEDALTLCGFEGRYRIGTAHTETPEETMLLETRQDDGVLIVTPLEKHLDGHVAPAFQTALLERIDAGARRIVVNLHCVQFMDSSGLGALVVALKRLGREGE